MSADSTFPPVSLPDAVATKVNATDAVGVVPLAELAINISDVNGYIAAENDGDITVLGLSRLQRWMLVHARENRLGREKVDLLYGEVLAHFYGFCRPEDVPSRGKFRRKFFKSEIIGRDRYNAACAAVSRAARRLDRRGLAHVMRAVYGHWAAIRLTDAGLTIAARIANTNTAPGGAEGREPESGES